MARSRRTEHGQALIVFVLTIVVIMAFASVVIDLGLLRTDTARLQNALDAGALAGAQQLPATGAAATGSGGVTATVTKFVLANYPSAKNLSVTYYCLVPADSTGKADTTQIPVLCSNFPSTSKFTCSGATCDAICDPTVTPAGAPSTESCDMIGVTATDIQPFAFGQFVGVPNGTVNGAGGGGNPVSYAANTPSLTPVDLALIVDRTGSMSGVDTQNAQAAAATLVKKTTWGGVTAGPIFNPALQWVAFGLLGPSAPTSGCKSVPAGTIGTATNADLFRWVPIGLSGVGAPAAGPNQVSAQDYSAVIAAINCYTNSGTGTDLADPIAMAQYELDTYGHAGHRQGIILETDGQPNTATSTRGVTGSNFCAAAVAAAANAKADHKISAQGIEIYTIGFGLDGSNNVKCPDTSGSSQGNTARQTLVGMASSPALDNNCSTVTNTPIAGQVDHFFCVPKSSGTSANLAGVFQAVASSLASGSHLVQLPVPPPIITSISPSHGPPAGGTAVTLMGKYFTDAYALSFGSGSVSFTVVSDTQITLMSPGGSPGAVNVTVTNPSGPSNAVRFSYP